MDGSSAPVAERERSSQAKARAMPEARAAAVAPLRCVERGSGRGREGRPLGGVDVTAVTWSRSHHPHRVMLASERYEIVAE
jgi:hypothetical protein